MRNHNSYFSTLAIALTISGIAIGLYVMSEWFIRIDHIPLTILSTLLIVTGLQLFGLISFISLVISMHREEMRIMNQILTE